MSSRFDSRRAHAAFCWSSIVVGFSFLAFARFCLGGGDRGNVFVELARLIFCLALFERRQGIFVGFVGIFCLARRVVVFCFASGLRRFLLGLCFFRSFLLGFRIFLLKRWHGDCCVELAGLIYFFGVGLALFLFGSCRFLFERWHGKSFVEFVHLIFLSVWFFWACASFCWGFAFGVPGRAFAFLFGRW